MVAFLKFDTFVEALAEKAHNLGSDTLKLALTNTAPTAATDVGLLTGSAHPPPASANGYTAGGNTVTISSSSQTSGSYTLVLDDSTFTAAGGTLGPFRFILLYNDTATNDELIGYWDYGTSITLNSEETFTANFDPSGALTIA
jgi:hypothetical protein